jgi:dTDP-glucose pyrophosphorylase
MNVLLPAAGFGKRNPDWAVKELKIHNGKPLIEYSFDHLRSAEAKTHIEKIAIITRGEKRVSLEKWVHSYLANDDLKSRIVFIEYQPENREWPSTLLASQDFWATKNLVLLPDTKLMLRPRDSTANSKTLSVIAEFSDLLTAAKTAWGIIQKPADEIGTYGNIETAGTKALSVIEKPDTPLSPWVWGCFGFQKASGQELLANLEKSTRLHQRFELPQPSVAVELSNFEDLSR